MTIRDHQSFFSKGRELKGQLGMKRTVRVSVCSHLYPQGAFVERKGNLWASPFSIFWQKVSSSSPRILLGWVVLVWVLPEATLRPDLSVKSLVERWYQETVEGYREERQRRAASQWRGHDQASYHCKPLALVTTGSSKNQCRTLTSELSLKGAGHFFHQLPPVIA